MWELSLGKGVYLRPLCGKTDSYCNCTATVVVATTTPQPQCIVSFKPCKHTTTTRYETVTASRMQSMTPLLHHNCTATALHLSITFIYVCINRHVFYIANTVDIFFFLPLCQKICNVRNGCWWANCHWCGMLQPFPSITGKGGGGIIHHALVLYQWWI